MEFCCVLKLSSLYEIVCFWVILPDLIWFLGALSSIVCSVSCSRRYIAFTGTLKAFCFSFLLLPTPLKVYPLRFLSIRSNPKPIMSNQAESLDSRTGKKELLNSLLIRSHGLIHYKRKAPQNLKENTERTCGMHKKSAGRSRKPLQEAAC